ncbi:hypothetical protein CANCADRAFT_102820 [Tortispora caseinolytica NRRL Y-17796]|uniref:Uncharacterized protein n=1 Tax=Tortispora caseinolytica NRRL Y-17796 TaxID=767744 RepID=A0A1E4TEJ8_9ASCO|nr:hypothetical protein CANCADRAFT_102820 [Tortispora caseinolytica NRRL Y-17796]
MLRTPLLSASKQLRIRNIQNSVRCLATAVAQHPVSAPTLADLESRWEVMSRDEQQDVITQLEERMKLPWTELTTAEKRAAWYIAYGPWGPRRPVHQPGDGLKIGLGIISGLVASIGLFYTIRFFLLADKPFTMSREWQEKTNEIYKQQRSEPFSGINAIQSPSRGPLPGEEDE